MGRKDGRYGRAISKGLSHGDFHVGLVRHASLEHPLFLHQVLPDIPGSAEEFIKIGCDTARSVLDLDEEGLISRTDLEAETVKEVIRILKKELE